jgi:uncharacterized protein (TIGR02118 family)
MIKLSVLYPKTEGATFDHDYYRNSHVPLCARIWNLDPSTVEIERGLNGPYEAAVHMRFESLEAMQAAMSAPGTGEILADVVNYTTISPVMQTSEIVE